MTTIRPNAEPAATTVQGGDIFLIDGATGVRALAASVVPIRDANANVAINNVLEGFATTVTAAGTTTLTVTSAAQQFFTGTTTQTVVLPVVSTLTLGQSFVVQNGSTGAVTIQSSGANTVKIIGPGTSAIITCILLTGTTAASWQATYFADIAASGKVLTVSNSLTLAGTDGTTVTFPSTSATMARTDAGQTFTGTNVFGVLTATSVNGNTITTGTGVLTLGAGKTLTASNSLTLAGTDTTIITFQGTDTYVGRATTDTLTNKTFDTAGTGNSFKINGTAITANTGTGSNVLATTPTLSQANLVGTTTNDSAAAGSVGEYISSDVVVGSAVSLTSTVAANVTSISLTAGDWDVYANIGFTGGATTTVNHINGSVSTTTATLDTTDGRYSVVAPAGQTTFNFDNPRFMIGPARFSLSGTTTIFMVAQAVFATSTCSAFGIIRARRVR